MYMAFAKSTSPTVTSSPGTSITPDDPLETVDIIITYDLAAKRTKRVELPTGTIQVLSRKNLIDMKRQSGRAQDLEDVAALEKL